MLRQTQQRLTGKVVPAVLRSTCGSSHGFASGPNGTYYLCTSLEPAEISSGKSVTSLYSEQYALEVLPAANVYCQQDVMHSCMSLFWLRFQYLATILPLPYQSFLPAEQRDLQYAQRGPPKDMAGGDYILTLIHTANADLMETYLSDLQPSEF